MSLVSGIQYSTSYVGRRNAIINGNFDVWQRGTGSFTSTEYTSDRWLQFVSGSTSATSRQTFTPGQATIPNNPVYYSRTVVTTNSGSTDGANIQQRVEGVGTFGGEEITLSFWAKADASKNIAIEFFQNFGTGSSPSSAVLSINVTTIALTTAWAKHEITFTMPSISGKTKGTNGDDYMGFEFWFDAGSSFASRTNSLGNQSGTFDIAQVQLEKGDTATDFERRSYAEEILMCMRYFQTHNFPTYKTIGIGRGQGTTTMYTPPMPLPVPMRTAPSGNTSTSSDIQIKRVSDNTSLSSTENVSAHGHDSRTFGFAMTYTHSSADETYRINTTASAFAATLDAEL